MVSAPQLAGVLDRHERVHGLAGLADRHDQRAAVDHRVAVAELVRQLDLARGSRVQCSMAYLRDHARVDGGAARDDDDLVDVAQGGLGDPQLVEDQPAGLVGAAEEGVRDRVRLLLDLLGHEVRVAALLGGRGVPVDVVGLALDGRAVEPDHASTESGVIVAIWSWPSSRASRVWPMNAATSEPRKFSPSPSPTTSGLLRRAPTTTPGVSAWIASSVKAPSRSWTADAHRLGEVVGLVERLRPPGGRRPRCRSRT